MGTDGLLLYEDRKSQRSYKRWRLLRSNSFIGWPVCVKLGTISEIKPTGLYRLLVQSV